MGFSRGLAGVLAGLAGCGPLVVAYPPPAALPTDMDAVDPGHVEVGAGLSGLPGTEAPYALGNFFGGAVLGSVGVGLSERVDLAVSASKHWQGPTAGLRVGVDLWASDRWDLGLVTGTGASLATGTSSRDVVVVDELGDPILDEQGEWVTEKETVDYAYGSVAPHLGLRAVWLAPSGLMVPFMLRSSYSTTWAREGLSGPMPRSFWQEVGLGLGYQYGGIELGVSAVGVLWVNEGDVLPHLWLNASMAVHFDPRESTR